MIMIMTVKYLFDLIEMNWISSPYCGFTPELVRGSSLEGFALCNTQGRIQPPIYAFYTISSTTFKDSKPPSHQSAHVPIPSLA
jgi:hypothetical protein